MGSVLFGAIVARIAGVGNLQTQGSYNIGATNIARVAVQHGKLLGIITALLDGSKGAIAILISEFLGNKYDLNVEHKMMMQIIVGSCTIIGHIFPIWNRFHGGKGIATFFGVMIVLNTVIGITLILIWIVTFITTRLSSLSSIASVVTGMTLYTYLLSFEQIWPFLCTCMIILMKHRENIKRLMNNSEKKLEI